MYFLIIALIVATAGSAVTIKTLIGYTPINTWLKVLISFFVVLGWTAPLYSRYLRKAYAFLGNAYPYIYNAIYILFGFIYIIRLCFYSVCVAGFTRFFLVFGVAPQSNLD